MNEAWLKKNSCRFLLIDTLLSVFVMGSLSQARMAGGSWALVSWAEPVIVLDKYF
jgi:hypothetical protein